MPFAKRDGCRIYWRLDGALDKPVLLLLHSIGTDMALWDRVLPYFLPHYQILRMDTRGHGASDAPPGDYTLDMLADDACAVLDAAHVARAAVCGISLGGMIAMALALKAPERLSAVILACTSAEVDSALWQARLEAIRDGGMAAIVEMSLQRFFTDDFRRAHPAHADTARSGLLNMDVGGYAGCVAAIRDMALKQRIGKIALPVLVISGSRDAAMPHADHGAKIAAAIAGSGVALLNAGHLAVWEVPADFSAAVLMFLEKPFSDLPQTDYQAGLARRRKILGDDWVDKSLAARTAFNGEFQEMLTRHVWCDIWRRPGLEDRTRRLLVVAITAALGRWEEFNLHVRAGLEQQGFSENELKETLMQLAIYAGVPAANTAFHEAAAIIKQRQP